MMETMIPPEVGMRLRMKKREAKEAQIKEAIKREKRGPRKREKKREGTMLLSF